MNQYDIEQTPMHFNKFTRIFVCIIIVFLIFCVLCAAFGRRTNTVQSEITDAETTVQQTSDVISSEDATTPDETSSEETTTLPIETTAPETTAPEITEPEPPSSELYLTLTDSERLILATLLSLECGGSPYETKMAVASVVVNRMNMWGLTLRQAVFQKNVFSPAIYIDQNTGENSVGRNMKRGGPYEECWKAVEDICDNGPTIPYYVIYFRSGHYHDWCTPYAQIGSLYFSYAEKYK